MFKKLSTIYNQSELQIIRGILEANNITYYKSSDFDGFIPVNTIAVNIYVDETDYEDALKLISEHPDIENNDNLE